MEVTLPGISLLLAAYNEAGPIGDVVRGLRQSLEEYGGEYEILVIDDGSEDGTGKIAAEAGAEVVTHPANKGYGVSLKTGARRARYPVLVFFDSDGQHDPADVKKIVEELARGEFDMVVGARGEGSHVSLARAPGKKLLARVANYLAETRIPDLNSGLRAVSRDVFFEFVHILPNQFSLTSTLTLALLKAGYTVAYVPIVVRRRSGRPSNVRIFRDGFKAFMLIVNTIVTDFNIGSGALLTIITSMIIFFFGIIADQLSSLRRERK
jgi:glycosyltransferase involved in cell wall biosynthesis